MEPEQQVIQHDLRQQMTHGESGVDMSYQTKEGTIEQDIGPQEYPSRDIIPPQYLQQVQNPQDLQQMYVDQYPPPGAGQVSPYQPVAGSFPQKDARMYHQQQHQQQLYPGAAVVYQAPGPGTNPYNQSSSAQLYPGYGTTQQQMVMAQGTQPNLEGVTFVHPVTATVADNTAPSDYLCLSILACLCLFCPTGCLAIYFSSQTRESIKEGDMGEARQRSIKTLRMVKISLVIFVVGLAVYLLWRFVLASLLLPSKNSPTYTTYDY